ncbi:MAG: NYN domain-containing protein [Dehalococcoidia bacterium]|nr:NYN domain-containing protein [Dehalococcoidia bacterium]
MAEQQIAVLIDYENVGLGSIRWLFDQISDIGRIVVKRAYADWSAESTRRDRGQVLELGIEPVILFHSAASGKNSSDIRLAIDAVDLLHGSSFIDTFVIVSADSDFVPLVTKLRSAGKSVIGAGRKAAVSSTLVASCDKYFYLDLEASPTPLADATQALPGDSLLVRAMKVSVDDQGRVTGSKLIGTMQRLDPAFNPRALGYSTFSRFLDSSPEVKVTRQRGRGDVIVELSNGMESIDQIALRIRRSRGQRGRGDVIVELSNGPATGNRIQESPSGWDAAIDNAWSNRSTDDRSFIPGTTAAAVAATALGVAKLKDSEYKTLQRLLDASTLLRAKWLRDGNRILRRTE